MYDEYLNQLHETMKLLLLRFERQNYYVECDPMANRIATYFCEHLHHIPSMTLPHPSAPDDTLSPEQKIYRIAFELTNHSHHTVPKTTPNQNPSNILQQWECAVALYTLFLTIRSVHRDIATHPLFHLDEETRLLEEARTYQGWAVNPANADKLEKWVLQTQKKATDILRRKYTPDLAEFRLAFKTLDKHYTKAFQQFQQSYKAHPNTGLFTARLFNSPFQNLLCFMSQGLFCETHSVDDLTRYTVDNLTKNISLTADVELIIQRAQDVMPKISERMVRDILDIVHQIQTELLIYRAKHPAPTPTNTISSRPPRHRSENFTLYREYAKKTSTNPQNGSSQEDSSHSNFTY